MTPSAPPASPLQEAVRAARQDLAKRLGLRGDAASALQTTSAREVTWRNSALGCPEPGGFYLQALEPGYRIVLGHNGNSYTYHAKRGGTPFLCPPERAEAPADAT